MINGFSNETLGNKLFLIIVLKYPRPDLKTALEPVSERQLLRIMQFSRYYDKTRYFSILVHPDGLDPAARCYKKTGPRLVWWQ